MGLAPAVIDVLDPAGMTCRDRMRQMLEVLDGGISISSEDLVSVATTTTCGAGHPARVAALQTPFFEQRDGVVRATSEGQNWLVEAGRPAPDWRTSAAEGAPPLREWQVDALDAWAGHGRIGVVEAVTGTGKSRVGVEAVREALADDYSVIIVVPTRDLVQQWCKTLIAQQVAGVASIGDGVPPRFGGSRRVLVGTVQSLHVAPPWRADGKVLLVADECHRYGSDQWRRILSGSYRRRLGLTATFERNDDGLEALLRYFGGTPCYRIGFDRAIADGVVAHYAVKLVGVQLSAGERVAYDAAHDAVVDHRQRLIAEGVPEEPFGLFMKVVSEYSKGDDKDVPAELVDLSRRYLKNFHERIRILSESSAKVDAARELAPRVAHSQGAVVFTRSIFAAEDIATALREKNFASEAIHSNLSSKERKERLHRLKIGRTKALVAPTVLDEGIDLPQIDLGIVMGGSKSRRQMIQRMGRVLRLKSDGRSATFIVVYAEHTVDDITQNDGREGCLDLIVQSADSVEHLDGRGSPVAVRREPATAANIPGTSSVPAPAASPLAQVARPAAQVVPVAAAGERPALRVTPRVMAPARSQSSAMASAATPATVDATSLLMTRSALQSFQRAHGGDDFTAEAALRATLAGLLRIARPTPSAGSAGSTSVRAAGFKVIYAKDRFQTYSCARSDGRSWPEASRQWELSRSKRMPDVWQSRPWPDSPTRRHAESAIEALGRLADLTLSEQSLDEHAAVHGGSRSDATEHLRFLLEHLDQDRDRCRRENGRLVVARCGYGVEIDLVGRHVVGYKSSGQYRRYGDYVEFGRADDNLVKISLAWREPDSRLDVSNLAELREVVDPSTIYYSNRTFAALTETVRLDFLNSWDADRYIRHLICSDLERATDEDLQILEDRFVLEGDGRTWMFAPDGQSAKISRKRRGPAIEPGALRTEVALASDPADDAEDAVGETRPDEDSEVAVAESRVAGPQQVATPFDFIAALAQLAELHGAGALTDEEFATAKGRVLQG